MVDDKWDAAIARGVNGELNHLVQGLIDRLTELSARYDNTLGEIQTELEN